MKYLFVLLSASLLASCSSGEKKIISVEKKVVFHKAAPVAANSQLTLQVGGMSCEHACGGAIRMALKKTNAVDRCSFPEFNADNEYNTAKITFDSKKISGDKILAIIETLNDGQFTTGKTETSGLTPVKS